MYHGEVNVAQDSLNDFLEVAEDLDIKGLTTGSKPIGSDNMAKTFMAGERKTNLPPGFSLTPKGAKKPKLSLSKISTLGKDILDTIEPLLEDANIKAELEHERSGLGE